MQFNCCYRSTEHFKLSQVWFLEFCAYCTVFLCVCDQQNVLLGCMRLNHIFTVSVIKGLYIYIYIYVCVCVCVCVHTYIHTHIHTHIYIFMYPYIHTYTHIHFLVPASAPHVYVLSCLWNHAYKRTLAAEIGESSPCGGSRFPLAIWMVLYHMSDVITIKEHSDSEKGNPLPPHGLLFPITSKHYFICIIP